MDRNKRDTFESLLAAASSSNVVIGGGGGGGGGDGSSSSNTTSNSSGSNNGDHATKMMLNSKRTKQVSYLNGRLLFCLTSAVVGSAFQFGYNTGVINSPAAVIRSFINETTVERTGSAMDPNTLNSLWAFTVAVFAVGGCIGGFCNGMCADYFGRKKSLLLNNVFGVLGALLMGLSKPCKSYEMIMVGRFVIGLNCGFNSGLCPMYINEIAPVKIRGSIGLLFQLGATSSILLSQVFGLPELLGNDKWWPLLLAVCGTFSLFQLATLPFCPESPRYLLTRPNAQKEAERSLRFLRATDSDVSDELAEMSNEAKLEASLAKSSLLGLFTSRALLFPTVISIVLHLSQQYSGINAVFYYSSDILKNSGIENAQYATPVIGAIMVVMTLVSIPLIEMSGRRFLHLLGLGGMFFFSILMTVAFVWQSRVESLKYLSIVSMMLYIVFFALGPGSIPWLIVAELFSQTHRSAAVSLAVLVNWTANVTVGQAFPPLFDNVTKEYTFILFTVMLALFWVFTFCFLPETKNKKVEEITDYFQDKRNFFYFRSRQANTTTIDLTI